MKDYLKDCGINVLTIDEKITNRAIFYMEEHFLSHHLQMAEALIGGTASVHNEPLLTGNHRRYKMLKDITVKRF